MHGMSAAVVGLVFASTARVIVGTDPRLALAAARRRRSSSSSARST